ncbi:MAG: T6SS effector amidase Tae4 family protein, partial [Hyphomicrobium sp.]
MIEFSDLWRGHPINESVMMPCIAPHNLTNLEGQPVLLGFPVFSNQCAIRMGVALRRAGVQPSQLSGISHCSVHPRTEMHFINANQLANGIARASIAGIGPTEKFVGADAAEFYPKIFGRTGIIYIQDYWRRT